MTYADLVLSARVLEPFFAESARLGLTLPALSEDAARYWRSTGLAAERAMWAATGGVNTHKGAIFLLGLLAFSCGRWRQLGSWGDPSVAVLDLAFSALARTLRQEVKAPTTGLSETYGEWARRRYGWGGMRHTVLSNFANLRGVLRHRTRWRTLDVTTRLGLARHHLFVSSQDTNLVKRAGWRAAQETLQRARVALRIGSVATPAGRALLLQLDREMSDRRWSASGSGDLLAAYLFLDRLDGCLMPRAGS